MPNRRSRRASRTAFSAFAVLCSVAALGLPTQTQAAPTDTFVRLSGHIPARALRSARAIGRLESDATLRLAFALPLRNQAALTDLIRRQQTPGDPLYGKYLTPAQFAGRFAPTQADYDKVAAYAQSLGLTVTGTSPNRLVLDASGNAATVEHAFGVRLGKYQAADGRYFHAPDAEPAIPAALAGTISAIVGLDNATVWRPQSHPLMPALTPFGLRPLQTGSGPGGALTPANIKAAYNLSGTSLNGTGQTLALFELDGYAASDITAYENSYSLRNVPLQNVLIDGYSGAAGSGAGEVTLDIELQAALAPGATKIMVYEGPNSGQGILDTYNKIATDNTAKQISTSWGAPETSGNIQNAENSIFQQMASQGQSLFAAAGDSGAYDNGSSLSVDDPASQPYVTGVGGTSLTTSGAGGPYGSEKTWNGGSVSSGAGGGGISTIWAIPSYQQGIVGSAASKGSTTMRNVPDVALDADPNTGYSIYFQGGWYIYGGTSCAAPLWSAFTALVNQQRAANGTATLGFANPPLYQTYAQHAADFHDIADGSTNLYYPAVSGYDNATGLGSFNGANLLADLAGSTTSGGGTGGGGTTPPAPTQLLGNPGFENGSSNPSPWSTTPYVIDNSSSEPPHSGSWKAWLCGYGTTHTDTVAQTVTFPTTLTSATLSFWLHIDSAETSTTTAYDTLKVQVRNSSGAVLATLATYSNLNKNSGYVQKSFNVASYKGQTVQIYLVGSENSARATSFVVDDFALSVQ